MNKKMLKTISLLPLAGTILSLSGCNFGGKLEGVKGTLKISIFEGGNGNTAFNKLAEAYKVYNPDAKIVINYSPLVRNECQTAVETGETDSDIFFIDGCTVPKGIETYHSIADISALYSMTPKAGSKEENITIGQKIQPEVLEMMKYQGDIDAYKGKYYTAPWSSGPASLILNIDALNAALGEGQWKAPRTTTELQTLCDRIVAANATVKINGQSNKIYPFIYSEKSEYWRYMYYTWIAQLMGLDKYDEQFLSVKINGEYNMEAFFTEEKTESYRELEKFIKRSNGYCDPTSASNKFMETQKYFMQGRACMYITGDWLEREMEGSSYNPHLEMIRTPMISSFVNKFEEKFSKSLGENATEKESKLCSLIDACDSNASSFSGLTDEEFNFVKQSRGFTYTLANGSYCIVPECSVNKELALDFLRFFYSDEGIQINLDDTKSLLPVVNPQNYHINGEVSAFRKSVNDIHLSSNFHSIAGSKFDPIRYRAGLDSDVNTEKPEVSMGKKSGALTADEYLAKERILLSAKWNDLMKYVQEK